MRHGKSHNHLGRKTAHRKSMLRNLTISLIEHKRISTTLAKAKALRVFAEPLLTKSKANTMHARRMVFSELQSKEAIKELFAEVAPKIADRPGGYLRIIRTGTRLGDNAETAMIELVDFNPDYNPNTKTKTGRTRRSRRGGKRREGASEDVGAEQSAAAVDADVDPATTADAATAGATEAVEPTIEEEEYSEVTMTDQIVEQNMTTVADADDIVEETETATAKGPGVDEPAAEPNATDDDATDDEDKEATA